MGRQSRARRFVSHLLVVTALSLAAFLGSAPSARAQFVPMGYGFGGYGYGWGMPMGGFGYGFGGPYWGYPFAMSGPVFNTPLPSLTTLGFAGPWMGYGGVWGNGMGSSSGYGMANSTTLSLGISPLAVESAVMERGLAGTGIPTGGRLVPGTYRIEIIEGEPMVQSRPAAGAPRAADQAPPPPETP